MISSYDFSCFSYMSAAGSNTTPGPARECRRSRSHERSPPPPGDVRHGRGGNFHGICRAKSQKYTKTIGKPGKT